MPYLFICYMGDHKEKIWKIQVKQLFHSRICWNRRTQPQLTVKPSVEYIMNGKQGTLKIYMAESQSMYCDLGQTNVHVEVFCGRPRLQQSSWSGVKKKVNKTYIWKKNHGFLCTGPWATQNYMLCDSKITSQFLCCLNSNRIEAHDKCIQTERSAHLIKH